MEEIRQAVPATHDQAVILASSAAVVALVRILQPLREALALFDAQVEKLAQAHPDFLIFDSFPGAGAALALRLIAAFGTNHDR